MNEARVYGIGTRWVRGFAMPLRLAAFWPTSLSFEDFFKTPGTFPIRPSSPEVVARHCYMVARGRARPPVATGGCESSAPTSFLEFERGRRGPEGPMRQKLYRVPQSDFDARLCWSRTEGTVSGFEPGRPKARRRDYKDSL